jgi:hypothetical protein
VPRNLLHRNIGAFSSAMLLLSLATLRVPSPTAQESTPPEGALQLTARLNPAGADASGRPASPSSSTTPEKRLSFSIWAPCSPMVRNSFWTAWTCSSPIPSGKRTVSSTFVPRGDAGRVDPLILPLCAGCNFSFPVDFTNYCLTDEPVLRSGHYSLEARFVGKAISPLMASTQTVPHRPAGCRDRSVRAVSR